MSNLTAADLEMFAGLGVHADLLERAQIRRVTDVEVRRDYGITRGGDMAGIVFPYLDPVTGFRTTARLRRDCPELDGDGKQKDKYICPFGDNRRLYFPPGTGQLLTDLTVPVIIVEAEKSALAIAALVERTGRLMLAVATGGCWSWRGKTGIQTGQNGEREEVRGPLPDFERISCTKRKVIIAFDADVASNPKVRAARHALAETLVARGARVFLANLPEEVA